MKRSTGFGLDPVKVFFALKDQINISTEELAHVVGIAPRTLLRRKQQGKVLILPRTFFTPIVKLIKLGV